jgi:two-component system cell cycle sensor histidine kinase/response regulator CckA
MATRILLVEDSPTQAEALRGELSEADYEVEVHGNGESALAALQAGHFDLVISDVMMPGAIDGYALCRTIKSGPQANLPVVLLTSLTDPMDIIRGLECGADNFLTKPYNPQELLERLRVLLDTRRARAMHRVSTGTRILFLGREYLITSDREQILDLLITTFEDAVRRNRTLQQREIELEEARAQLSRHVKTLEARLQHVLETVPDVLFSADVRLRTFHYASPGAEAVLGMSPAELVRDACKWAQRVHDADLPLLSSTAERVATDGRTRQIEFRYRRSADSLRWLSARLVRVIDPDTGSVGINGVMSDITEQRQQATLFDTLRSVGATVLAASDFDTALQTVVAQVCKHTNWPLGHAWRLDGDTPISRGWYLADPLRFESFRLATDANKEEWSKGMSGMVERSGDVVWLVDTDREFNTARESDARQAGLRTGFAFPVIVGSKVVAVLEFFDDQAREADPGLIAVTRQLGGQLGQAFEKWQHERERRAAEEQLRQSQKMEAVGRLAGGVAHDFNNLLMVILGEAEVALDTGLAPESRVAVESIIGAANRAAQLTKQLLAFSRRQVFEPKLFSLSAMVAEMEGMLRRVIDETITVNTRLAPDLPVILADRGQVEQVLMNLVVNARDAMPNGGTLAISTSAVLLGDSYAEMHRDVKPGRYACLEVSDTGTGMSPEVINKIFDPFFTTKEQGKGTGLGLATSFGIVKQSEGHISVYSEPGIGTTMRVYFPVSQGEAEEMIVETAPAGGGNETLLLVEDDPEVRRIVSRMLISRGFEVITAEDANQALQALEWDIKLDAMITDVVLPGRNGRELADVAKSIRPDLTVLYVSGYTDDVMLHHKLLEHGAVLVQKPFTPDVLIRRLRELLDARTSG